jgi:hypothetical protein
MRPAGCTRRDAHSCWLHVACCHRLTGLNGSQSSTRVRQGIPGKESKRKVLFTRCHLSVANRAASRACSSIHLLSCILRIGSKPPRD